MPKLPGSTDIPHDAPLTEIWVQHGGGRFRVYRGDTKAHINWKIDEWGRRRGNILEVIEIPRDGVPA